MHEQKAEASQRKERESRSQGSSQLVPGQTEERIATEARAEYDHRLAGAVLQIEEIVTLHRRLVWLRTGLFFGAIICLVLGYGGDAFRLPLITMGWLLAAGFLSAIVWHEHLRLRKLEQESRKRLYERLLARLDRNWEQLPDYQLSEQHRELHFADDLDVAGPASLLSLLSLAGTRMGRLTMERWLAKSSGWSDVQQRQHAVRLLQPCRDLRLEIVQTVEACTDGREDASGLADWAIAAPWLPSHRAAHVLSYIGPSLIGIGTLVLLTTLGSESKLALNVAVGLIAVGMGINILLTIFWGSWLHQIFQKVTGHHQSVFRLADIFASLERLPQDDGRLDLIRQRANGDEHAAVPGFNKLLRLVRMANLQRDPTLYVVYLFLQLACMWDFRILRGLEKWQAQFGTHVAGWFEALGECEALISGATLADEYPAWSFPQPIENGAIADDGQSSEPAFLIAQQLGHPLLPDDARVCNDLTITHQQPLVLVTGSNMAGKSTFLRSVGLNLLLARTGSPVCASQLCTPLYELATSIRVRDSLRDGVSFFMAELKRLKEVVDIAAEHQKHELPPILFLLDEILQGTNSRERQIAVASVIETLLSCGACGFVSTHDLDLAAAESIQPIAQVVHFREFFEQVDDREVMRFDYRMHPGPTPTTNALKLLNLVGLRGDGQEDRRGE